jgi:hypothetical protein
MKKKTADWREQCVEAICGFGGTNRSDGRPSRERKQVNYDLMNSIFDETDYDYVLNPYNINEKVGNTPARIRQINQIRPIIDVLRGEEMSRPFNFMSVAVNGEAVNAKEEQKKGMLLQVINQMIMREAGIEPPEPQMGEDGKPLQPQTLPQVEEYAAKSMRDIREQWANQILQYGMHDQKLKQKFNEGFEHALVAGEEIYYIGIDNGQPVVRTVNPINFDFDKNPDRSTIEDADWAREERYMTVGQILDEYGEFLTDEQVQRLDDGLASYNMGLRHSLKPEFAYDLKTIRRNNEWQGVDGSNTTHYVVTTVVWKSMKKIQFLKYFDPETGEEEETIVAEDFKLSEQLKALGATLEPTWIAEVWKGTKIGDDFYVDINPLPNQMRDMDNPYECKLPYVGRIYNSTNSVGTSLVDLMKPHQYLLNIVWFRLENEIAKSKGKKFIMDMALIPKSEGYNMEKWMYMFDNLGIAMVNSFEEGSGAFQGKTSNFNQLTAVDMAMSQVVGQYMEIINKLEQLIQSIAGVTPQRLGAVSNRETARGVERSVTQSSHITEPYFYAHAEVKKQVLQQYLEAAKLAFPSTKKINYITDDAVRIMATLDMEKFADTQYGVFVTDATRDFLLLQKMQNLAEIALQTDKANLSDIARMYQSSSISDLRAQIEKAEAEG